MGLEWPSTGDNGGSSQCGTAVFPPGSPPTHKYTFGPSWSVRLLAAPRSVGPAVFPRAHRQPSTHLWSLLECAAHGRSSQCGTRGFPGLTANPHPHKLFSTQCERKLPHSHTYPWCQNANTNKSARAARPHKTTRAVKLKSTVDKQWRHTS